ncbi:diguanylate cyclase (GGDEF) domain-containing protein [Pseudobutyrivibrio sp. YE44]|uniref:bifunctional diguanylate cyclase/phosphodiesterase n=1 Tax=Pseudobutyrivibrio sp. YE44 TaxID=1520802 RepID=UPI000890A19D|nr:bifunctional diguanylate cyclase/phosphodiesterase [Pseudobutyrivibrio sp. YE44]SDB33982.1 diguanylate cyclase (GGDEF) domain-containing protein [Pseudobutyrivibrio sp. YE44]
MAKEEYLDTGAGIVPLGLPGGFFIYEADGEENLLFADSNVINMFDCETFEELKEYVGGSFKGMVYKEDLYRIENQIQAQTFLGEKRHDYVRYRIQTKKGTIKYLEDFGHLLHWMNGKSFFYVFIVDVDQNEYLNTSRNSFAEAEVLVANREVDSLTGLFTMSFFYHRVQLQINSAENWRDEAAFVHFDVPNFKLYNERHGFKMGDELLVDLANTIKDVFTDGIVARFSDDHFVVFTSTPREGVIESVEEVYKRMLLSDDVNKKVRIKAGIYFLDDQRAEVGLACDHARLACNSIKNRHDLNYCIYDEMLRDKLRRQQYVVDHIDEAIAMDYIKVYYQPIIRVATKEVCGMEALVRWVDPSIGMMSPLDFIETLEHFHLIHLVDEFMVKKVCQDYRYLLDNDLPTVPVSVNISRLDFDVCSVLKLLSDFCEIYDVPIDMMEVEITESAFNDNTGLIREEVKKIREAGFEIWVDDFGSGFSSLNTIAEYDFDVLKLDLVFLKSFQNQKTRTLMNYVIQGANELGVKPLCEGVECEEHYQFLKEIGCDKCQGYYFGKPMPLEDMLEHLADSGMTYEDYSY